MAGNCPVVVMLALKRPAIAGYKAKISSLGWGQPDQQVVLSPLPLVE
jgi:hypothetical protein